MLNIHFLRLNFKSLIREFNQKDQEMTEQLNELISIILKKLNQLRIFRPILNNWKTLIDYFVDQRKEKAELALIKYRDMLKAIEIVPIENTLGTLKYGLKIGEKFYKTSQKPRYGNSECVTLTSKTSEGHVQLIKYEYEDCSEDEKNKISVSYKYWKY